MKRMLTVFLPVLLLLCSGVAIGSTGTAAPATLSRSYDTVTLENTKWVLSKLYSRDKASPIAGQKAFFVLDLKKERVSGNGSCNSFGGSIFRAKDSLSFSRIFSTKMFCESVQHIENQFFEQLALVNRFEIRDKKLLLFRNKQLLLELTAS